MSKEIEPSGFITDELSDIARYLLQEWVESGSYVEKYCYDYMRALGSYYIPKPKELEPAHE